ncbi:MAG: ABC transporter permease subunit [Eubacterium sp.]|nr:ABC transporter permease subunit [Eubacterium sp.]
MRIKVIKLLLKKELLDVIRDRKAVIMLILVPLLVYPLIFFAAFGILTMIETNMSEAEYRVMLDVDDGGCLEEQIDEYNKKKNESEKSKSENSELQYIRIVSRYSLQSRLEEYGVDLDQGQFAEVDAYLQNEDIDVYVSSSKDSDGRITYSTRYVSSITNSDYGEIEIKEVLDELSKEKTEILIEEAGLDAENIIKPFDIERTNIASQEQSAGSILGMILPFMMIISLLMGTMYPAIDTTAGEKERGTLETLLTLPVKNHEIIIAKFITVALMGIISALLNLISMAVMVLYMVKIVSLGSGNFGLDFSNFRVATFIPASIITILAIFAFSLFISAVTMCVAAFARSYKEANNYITPVTLIVMLTAYIGFIPNVELNSTMALVPVANICLLIKELLLFKIDMSLILIVLLSNIFYAGLAIIFLSRIYDSEGILFDEGGNGLLLFQRRKDIKAGGRPTSGDAWFIVCFVMIIYLYIGSMLQMKYQFLGVFLSQMLILIIPLIMAIYTKRSLKQTYNLNKFSLKSLLGSFCLFIGAFLVENTFSTIMYRFFPEQYDTMNTGLTDILNNKSFILMLIVVAITPAICEELMFRGFIQSGFSTSYKPATTIILVALIFGVYHTSLVRLLPTAMLGACFAIINYYSGSIIPGMIMHCINNAIAVIAMKYPDSLEKALPFLFTESESPSSLVIETALGIGLIIIGMFIFIKTVNKKIKCNRER